MAGGFKTDRSKVVMFKCCLFFFFFFFFFSCGLVTTWLPFLSVPLVGYALCLWLFLGCVQLTATVTRKKKKKKKIPITWQFSAEGSECPHINPKLSFGTPQIAAYANKYFVCLFVTKIWKFFTGLILYIWFYIKLKTVEIVFRSDTSLAKDNCGLSPVLRQIKRVYNSCSEDAKKLLDKKKTLASDLFYWKQHWSSSIHFVLVYYRWATASDLGFPPFWLFVLTP